MSSKYSDFEIRMKKYEKITDYYLNDDIPIIVRLDGRAFHTFTRDLPRPYSEAFHNLMVSTTCHLIQECSARYGYTQSDEISLLLVKKHYADQTYFNGRIQKICSILASVATLWFNNSMETYLPQKVSEKAYFDCRVYNISNNEMPNYFVWRQRDATRNSIQMAGQSKFKHSELENKNVSQIQEMLFSEYGINWNDYPEFFKRGSLCKQVEYKSRVPPEYANLTLPFDQYGNRYVMRSRYERVETPIFNYDSECLKF